MTDELQASRLLVLAMAALERGDSQGASEMTALAMRFMERAVSAQPTTQRQQQIQPKKDENKE
jgi:hypothetical protein